MFSKFRELYEDYLYNSDDVTTVDRPEFVEPIPEERLAQDAEIPHEVDLCVFYRPYDGQDYVVCMSNVQQWMGRQTRQTHESCYEEEHCINIVMKKNNPIQREI